MSTITAKIQLRRDTSANWTSNNPILLEGEMALSTDVLYSGTDQPRYKIGNGVDTWLNLDYVPEGGTSTYPEKLFLTIVNKTTDNLLASGYKVLKVATAQGQRLAVDYALADSDANSADTIGVVYENINNNQTGKIVVIGEITGINTTGSIQGESWSDGDLLFLSATVEGGMTTTRPTAPNHGVVLGYVVYSHVNQGKIYIKIDNGYEIGELHNCYLPSPNNNDGIFWSSGTTRYENKSISTVLGYTPSQGYTLLFTAGISSLISPADATTYYFGSGRASIYSPDHAVVIPKAGTLKAISFFHVVNSTLGTAENSTLSVQVRNTGYSGSVSTTTQITNTYKFNTTYNSTMFTGLNIDLPEGCAVDIKWLTPTWVTNPAQIQINATLFIV
jgi:hypothetical protein